MQTIPPTEQRRMGLVTVGFASAGVASVLASALALLACSGGLLFSGVSSISSVLVTVLVCAVVALLTAVLCRRKKTHFGWRTLVVEVSLLALVAIGVLTWEDTQRELTMFMNPAPVPKGLRVYHGRNIMFSSFVHFSAPSAEIARLIQLKELAAVPDDVDKEIVLSGYMLKQHLKAPWDWWQPAAMSNPRFFYRHHESFTIQGWSEGWWVNGPTNEVYAFIGG